MKKIILLIFTKLFFLNITPAQEYNASLFGCVSDGLTNNTSSIQYAIDFIAAKGGGKLNFFVGRYVTGGLKLKSNVTVELHEGAVLLASSNMNDYLETKSGYAFLVGEDVTNFRLTGKGTIEIQSRSMENKIKELNEIGVISYNLDKMPDMLNISNAKDVVVDGIMFLNGGNSAVKVKNSANILLQNLIIKSKSTYSSGTYLENAKNITLKNIYIDVVKKPIFKLGQTEISEIDKCITPNGKSII